MNEITYEEVQKFLLETEFDHMPGQIEISFPIIQRIHRRLQQGSSFSEIKLSGERIVDGHHRYICHQLLGMKSKTTIGGANSHKVEFVWGDVHLTDIDYDDEEARQRFEERYDKTIS
ncbi:hypothetical protein L1276_000946 [Flavobacterium sp. HSC-32F16]|uniref:hypothetical protein n=1 Tax=Flavobacterium sp. HSC-32F16 TaxID=2910964 RepID=UPI0020A32291|nr:hypothetical protein [Flavobacterium sp. HSC-32F16]MCP2025806.1 hypothetical protein [Flavobacterium sp. HSC-32F16]